MLSFSVILLIANSLLLKPLYDYSIKRDMLEGIESLSQVDFNLSASEWTESITDIDPGHAYDIIIEQSDVVVYSSSMDVGIRGPGELNGDALYRSKEAVREKPLHPSFPADKISNWTLYENDIYAGVLKEPNRDSELYVMHTSLGEDTQIYLTQGVEPIRKSVYQANFLLGIVTTAFLLIGIIVAMRISKKFTRPIQDMQTHVNQLSRLEFETGVTIETGDELEALNQDIEVLSGALQGALKRLEAQNKQLEKDIESQRKFISNASHELRTPLALIKGYADEIVQGFVSSADQQKIYIEYIAEESVKMKRLLNEILELSRLESGRLELMPSKNNVKEAIETFLEKYAGFIEEKGLEIKVDLEPVMGYFDLIRFEQLLANYISNAGKYCDQNKRVEITAKSMTDKIRVTVTNSGGPIEDDVMLYIWDGFYKADTSRSYDENSYGLGLSIVKAIQEIAGQDYGCMNQDGKVSFWFDVASV
jgi:signal transduction histidine kinase